MTTWSARFVGERPSFGDITLYQYITESFHKAYEFGFDIGTPTDIVQAHMHDQSGVIPKESFGQLLPEYRKAWSQLSDDVQVDIRRALQVNGSQHS
jgi:hypothetical protein